MQLSIIHIFFKRTVKLVSPIEMEIWFILILSVLITAIINSLLFTHTKKKLPPEPFTVLIIGNLLWLTKSFSEIEPTLKGFMLKYSPIISPKMGSRTCIFISSHSLAHCTLVQNGAVFSNRPKPPPTGQITASNQRNISTTSYGPIWRLFRRNLTSEILLPASNPTPMPASSYYVDCIAVDISQYGQVSEIQSKLYEEIAGVMGRHPQSHFVLPHLATEEVELEAYVVPKNATINFMAADLGWDPKVWKDLMEFKPDRFILMNKDDVFDITRNKEIKMMPFGAGKRICPSFGLPILHLEYFVANLV
ncbi:hypothetical protein LguiA_007151 [Lonicera macranthoides]